MKRSFKYRFEQSENKGLVSAAQNDMMLRINDIDLTVKRYCDFVANDITDLK
ncbi:MAG: hypothetical protein IKJ63_08320 [Clostridia bacterium]|nr:hypothetical protein [Clostridia bacterium]MBR3955461.1 hypothetical protein [Clostridia bacterium]